MSLQIQGWRKNSCSLDTSLFKILLKGTVWKEISYIDKVQTRFHLIHGCFTVQYPWYDIRRVIISLTWWEHEIAVKFSKWIWICRVKIVWSVQYNCFISAYNALGTCIRKTSKQNSMKPYLCSYMLVCMANILYLLLWNFPSQIV